MASVTRNTKTGGTLEFHDEWEQGFDGIKASEVDADFDTIFNAWNTLIPDAILNSGLPASGPAGGDLTGTYPNPTIAASAVGNTEISDVAWGKVTGAPTSLPPSGAAGGDLGGSYPNPSVVRLNGAAVGTTTPLTRGDILVVDSTLTLRRLPIGAASLALQSNGTDVVWGTPLGGPPSGAAGGDLTGAYPNPTIAANAVGNAEISDVSWGKVTGAPTSFPPAGSAGGDLAGAYPNPTIKPTSLPWTVSGSSLTPTDTTKRVYVPGDVNGVVVEGGNVAAKARIYHHPTAPQTQFSCNWLSAVGADDAVRPSWFVELDCYTSDRTRISRQPAGGGGFVNVLIVSNAGDLTISGASATKASGTTWANPSDERMKRNVADYGTGLEAIKQLRPVSFEYNGELGSVDTGKTCYGFVAQEVESVMPECVSEKEWHDPDEKLPSEVVKTLDQSNVILALVNAVKELAARVEALG